jgi:outer membrane protein TolC
MFQETGPGYRDYYMLTFNMSLPRRKRVNAQVAEAAEMLEETKASLDAQLQQQLAEVQKQYVTATSTGEQLTEYRDGLIPQAESLLHASLTAYQSASGDLSPVLLAISDVLCLHREAAQVLLDHEIAVSNLETLTGETLQ